MRAMPRSSAHPTRKPRISWSRCKKSQGDKMTRSKTHDKQDDCRSALLRRLVTLSPCHLVMNTALLVMLGTGTGCHKADSASPRHEISSTASSEESQGSPWFVDISDDAGLNFVHD